jgi:hypothetical protein
MSYIYIYIYDISHLRVNTIHLRVCMYVCMFVCMYMYLLVVFRIMNHQCIVMNHKKNTYVTMDIPEPSLSLNGFSLGDW